MLTYNGVSFPFTLTEAHESGPEKDPTGADTLYTKTTIRVSGVLSAGNFPAVNGETPAATADRITHLLTTPRRSLVYTVGPTTMLQVPSVDDANGPEPDARAFSIRYVGEGSFQVEFAVTVRLRRCTGADSRGYLSLKWADGESIAPDWTVTRRRTGLLITSRRFGSPDALRGVVTPAVPAGFRRKSADYELSEDGLRLKFTFVDEQLHKALPYPAVKVTGTQVETVPMQGGMRVGELSIRLQGIPGADPRELFAVAVRIGLARVYASNPTQDGRTKKVLIGGAVRESLNDAETVVELSLQWQISPPGNRVGGAGNVLRKAGWGAVAGGVVGGIPGAIGGGINAGTAAANGNTIQNDQKTAENRPVAAVPTLAGWLGLPFPGADPSIGVAPPTRGVDAAASLKLYAAALMDPCGSTANLQPYPGNDNLLVGTDPTTQATTTLRTGPAELTDDTVYAQDDSPGIWEHWLMRYTFRTKSGYGVVPATAPNTPGAMVRYGNPEKFLRVEWELKRTGDLPPLPEPKVPRPGGWTGDGTHDPNWVGTEEVRTYENVDVAADGVSFVYTAAGWSEFECLDATKAGEAYPVPPWLAPAARPAAPTTLATSPPPAPPAGQLPPAPAAVSPVKDYTIKGVPPPNP